MGHERIGFLPRTKQWNAIVGQLSLLDGSASGEAVSRIADDTLSAIQNRYGLLHYDESVVKAEGLMTTTRPRRSCSMPSEGRQ